MKASESRLVIPDKTPKTAKKWATEMAPAQLNEVRNLLKESSCQGEDVSSKINKENLSSEHAVQFTKWKQDNENQIDTESKHGYKMPNMKRQFEDNSRLNNDHLSRAYEKIENQRLEKASYMSKVEELNETISDLHNTIVNLKFIPNN